MNIYDTKNDSCCTSSNNEKNDVATGMFPCDTEKTVTLLPEIENDIRAKRQSNFFSPYHCKDSDVIRREFVERDSPDAIRSAFSRDIDKIVNLPPYNRYSDKTQVFSFIQNDDICRRGLHVQLVSRVARTIGFALGLNTDLIEAIALGHDIGHTPFGHAGELFLNNIYHKNTGRCFKHNVHSARVLDVLYPRNISLQTLDGCLCHNGEFAYQELKIGSINSFEKLDLAMEQCCKNSDATKLLRPSTLEGCVVRVSDMIAYLGKDRQDAKRIKYIKDFSCFSKTIIGTSNSAIISNLICDIVNNSYGTDRIRMSKEVFEAIVTAKKENYNEIYVKEGLMDGQGNVVEEMFNSVYEHLLAELKSGDTNSCVYKHHIAHLAKASETIKEEDYLKQDPNQIVLDFIASMTDSYFTSLYYYLFPNSSLKVGIDRFHKNKNTL